MHVCTDRAQALWQMPVDHLKSYWNAFSSSLLRRVIAIDYI